MLRSSPILIWTFCAAVFVLSICKAPARDLGQWDGADPLHRKWFNELMRPDEPYLRCCGLADAYWADSYEVKGDQYIAIITDTRPLLRAAWRRIARAGNVRFWPKADIPLAPTNVGFGGKADITVDARNVR